MGSYITLAVYLLGRFGAATLKSAKLFVFGWSYTKLVQFGAAPSCTYYKEGYTGAVKSPIKHDTLKQCWVNVGPPSGPTLTQHWFIVSCL